MANPAKVLRDSNAMRGDLSYLVMNMDKVKLFKNMANVSYA